MVITIPSHTSYSHCSLCQSTAADHQKASAADNGDIAFSRENAEANDGARLEDATLDDEHTQLINSLLTPSSADSANNLAEADDGLQLDDIPDPEALFSSSSPSPKAATITCNNVQQPANCSNAILNLKMHHYTCHPTSTAAVTSLQHRQSSNNNVAALHQQHPSPTVSNASINRQCANCGARNTPTWRRCPEGKLLLCNACGLYIKNHKIHRKVVKAPDGQLRVTRAAGHKESSAVKRRHSSSNGGGGDSVSDACGDGGAKKAKSGQNTATAAYAFRHHNIIQSIDNARHPVLINQTSSISIGSVIWLPCAHCSGMLLLSLHTAAMMQQRGISVICDACWVTHISAAAFFSSPNNGSDEGVLMMNEMVEHSSSSTTQPPQQQQRQQQWHQMQQQTTNSLVHEMLSNNSSDGEVSDSLADMPSITSKDAQPSL